MCELFNFVQIKSTHYLVTHFNVTTTIHNQNCAIDTGIKITAMLLHGKGTNVSSTHRAIDYV